MISVVIPLYNKSHSIERALRSVIAQTLHPDEIIVVDDGSTDPSRTVVENYLNTLLQNATTFNEDGTTTKSPLPAFRLLAQTNQGVSAARNSGVEAANGNFVAFLDADDEWKPEFLATMRHLSEIYPDCNLYASSYEQHDAQGRVHETRLSHLPFFGNEGILSNYFEVATHSDPPICSISLMVRKSALNAVGGFPLGIEQGEDLLTWARLAANNKIAYTRQSLAIFHNEQSHSTEQPKRIPPQEDVVGDELQKIFVSHREIDGLQEYVAHWHKMRASIYLRLPNQTANCRREIRISQTWSPNKKLWAYYLLTLLPLNLRMPIIQKLSAKK